MPDVPLHHLLIHFPIVLALFALAYDAWAEYADRPELHRTGYGLTIWATLGGVAAIVTGLQIAGLTQGGAAPVTGHALYGIAATLVLAGVAFMRYSARGRTVGPEEPYRPVIIAAQAAAALLVVAAALTGHGLS